MENIYKKKITARLQQADGVSAREVADELGLERADVSAFLKGKVDDGTAFPAGKTRARRYYSTAEAASAAGAA